MVVSFSSKARKDIQSLLSENIKLGAKLWEILLDIHKSPFSGIGKPEPLKGNMSGFWSRRITEKHRIVYSINDNGVIQVASCYGHYD